MRLRASRTRSTSRRTSAARNAGGSGGSSVGANAGGGSAPSGSSSACSRSTRSVSARSSAPSGAPPSVSAPPDALNAPALVHAPAPALGRSVPSRPVDSSHVAGPTLVVGAAVTAGFSWVGALRTTKATCPTVKAQVVVHHTHDRLTAALAFLSGEAETSAGSLAAEALGEPADKQAEAGAAHANEILFCPEALSEVVIPHVDRQQQGRQVVQR
jgi:hypothetical protein